MALTMGVDIGGTKVAAGVVDETGRVIATERRSSPSTSPAEMERIIADLIGELSTAHPVEAVGLGAPGFVSGDRSTVRFTPNVAWRDEPLREAIEKRCGLPAVVENDANTAAWAEAKFGAGRGDDSVAMVTVGTGLGGGIVLDGQLYRGRNGIAAEVGHMIIQPGGRRCGCGQRGCWERYASGRALLLEAREVASVRPATATRLLELGGGSADAITGPDITRAAREGDEVALECFRIVGTWLGVGMANVTSILDPGVFVLGGGVSETGELLLTPAWQAFQEHLSGREYRPVPEVRLAQLGQQAGIVGAADLARYR
jgi:glucokinase